MFEQITADELEELGKPQQVYTEIPQEGPLRFFDAEMLCTNSRYKNAEGEIVKTNACKSPTTIKIRGLPRCMMHALKDLNEMLVEQGVLS